MKRNKETINLSNNLKSPLAHEIRNKISYLQVIQ